MKITNYTFKKANKIAKLHLLQMLRNLVFMPLKISKRFVYYRCAARKRLHLTRPHIFFYNMCEEKNVYTVQKTRESIRSTRLIDVRNA